VKGGGVYTTQEVADLFRVTTRTIKRWVADGKLKPVKTPGGHNRFTQDAIDKLTEEK
jgi:putative resolvase